MPRYLLNLNVYVTIEVEADTPEEADAVAEATISAGRYRVPWENGSWELDFLYDVDEYEADMAARKAERKARHLVRMDSDPEYAAEYAAAVERAAADPRPMLARLRSGIEIFEERQA